LGISDHIGDALTDVDINLNNGDIMLLFTDGVTESINSNGEMFGQNRLKQALNTYANLPVGKLRDRIIEDVVAFQEEQVDDMTLVVVKR
jgi:serine phosphatase RsbU (regulator of sigma subunit)